MEIIHNLLPKQKSRKHGLGVTIDLFPMASELYDEFNRLNLIDRLKRIKQLGNINVSKRLEKTRYDYVMLQLYLHQLIRKNIQNELKYSYNNKLKPSDLLQDYQINEHDVSEQNPITLADVMQTLTIAYNIGHFANTFVASKAIIMLANSEPAFCEHIVNASEDERYREAAYVVLNSHNYQRVHLLNTLLALEKCDQSNRSVQITKELILAYLMENKLSGDSKLHEYFKIFRRIRTVSFVTYDLQIADVPFTVDLWNNKGLLYLLREYLAEFNNNDSAISIITEIAQMLDSSVYNKLESVICSTHISKQIIRKMCTGDTWEPYYQNYWLDFDSALNKTYPQVHDYRAPYLKLTFRKEHLQKAENLYRELDKQNNIRAGYYLRHSGEMTIVISVSKNTDDKAKASFRVLRTMTKYTRQMGLSVDDGVYILATKFFLYYLFHERHLTIKPVLDDKRCVICTKGKNARILELGKLLNADGSADEKHEIEAVITYLNDNQANDTTITVCGSTIVYKNKGEASSEFDGIIIYPNKSEKQIVLIEAKNTNEKPGYGKKCLHKKLKNLGIPYNYKDIIVFNHDAYFIVTV